jgi:DNA-binding CsgD family transcriptional regulator
MLAEHTLPPVASNNQTFGREQFIDSIVAGLTRGVHVSISGVKGIGTTTILTAVFEALMARGDQPVRLHATETQRSFGSLDPLISGVASDDRFNALSAAIGFRSERQTHRPLLIIDDAQFVDEESAQLLTQLALAGHVVLVMGWRTGLTLPSSFARLAMATETHQLLIGPLDESASSALMEQMLAGRIERGTLHQLIRASEGNPSVLHALVKGSIAANTLVLSRETWRLVGDLTCTPAIAAIVRHRIAQLSPEQLEAVELIALAQGLTLDTASTMFAESDLESLERLEMISVTPGDRSDWIDVAAPMDAIVLRDELGVLRRRRLYRTLAESSAGESDGGEMRSILWHVRGGVSMETEPLMAAARQAFDRSELLIASELAIAAYQASGDIEAAILSLRYLAHSGRQRQASELASEAMGRTSDSFERAAILMCLLEEAWWFGEDTQAIFDSFDKDLVESLGEWEALLAAQRTTFAVLDGDLDAAELSNQLVNSELPAVRLIAGVAAAQLASLRNDANRGLTLGETLRQEASQPDLDHRAALLTNPGIHVVGLIGAMVSAGLLEPARAAAVEIHRIVAQGTGLRARAWAASLLGQVLIQIGDYRSAAAWLVEAEALWTDCELPGPAAWSAGGRATCLANLGEVAAAREAIQRCEAYNRRGFRSFDVLLPVAHTWIATLDRDVEAARVCAHEAVEVANRSGATSQIFAMAHELSRLGQREATHLAVGYASTPTSDLGKAQLGFARSWLDDDAAGLEAAGELWARIGAPIHAAEAFTLAANLHRHAKATSDAARLEGRAGEMLIASDPARTPILQGRRSSGPLTPRLYEVAELACQGLRAAEIATKLSINERSVESHIQRIYLRLGVTSRSELIAKMETLAAQPSR